MRTAFFLLLLANVALFAWTWFGPEPASGELHLLEQQLNPEAIKLITPEQVSLLAGVRSPDAGSTAGTAASGAAETAAPATGGAAASRLAACLEWGPVAAADLTRAGQALAPLELGPQLSTRRVEEKAGYWVFLPAQANRQAAQQKTVELKQLGVAEFFVIQDDPKLRFAISLGVFSTEDAARLRLEELRARGVRSAQMGARESQEQKTFFRIRNAAESLATRLNELKQGFAGSGIRECGNDASNATQG